MNYTRYEVSEIIDVVVERLCNTWADDRRENITDYGIKLGEIDDEFYEWRNEYVSEVLQNPTRANIGIMFRDAIQHKFSEGIYVRMNMYDFIQQVDRDLRSRWDENGGDDENYTDLAVLDVLMNEYISDHKTDVSLKEILECNVENMDDDDFDDEMYDVCQDWIFRKQDEYGGDMDWRIEDVIDKRSEFDNYDDEYTDNGNDFDEDEYKKITREPVIEAYKKKVEAPIIKFQASCRRITEIWKFVRNMNELCSVGCGNWK